MGCNVTMVTQQYYIKNSNHLLRKVHLTILSINNFKMVEAMEFEIIATSSPSIASPP
jgi:hypothetical protein